MQPELDVKSTRLRSLDAYRGFVMLAMASGGAGALAGFVDHGNDVPSHILNGLRHQLDHVAWRGGVFWDMIQPSFMFMVGVAMPFSFASRTARGEPWSRMLGHALVRSVVLVHSRSSWRRMAADTRITRSSTCSARSAWVIVRLLAARIDRRPSSSPPLS